MKQTLIVILALLLNCPLLLAGDGAPSVHPRMAKLKDALPIPHGWSCVADHSCMVISRREPVTLLNLVSLPASNSREELLDQFGVKTPYQIVLLFRPGLSEQELRDLQNLRKQAIESARANDDPKYSRSARASRKFILPTYSYQGLSIYVHRTDDGAMEIYPKQAAAERDVILKAIDEFFRKK